MKNKNENYFPKEPVILWFSETINEYFGTKFNFAILITVLIQG